MNNDYDNNELNYSQDGVDQFVDPIPQDALENVKNAKLALEMGLISLLGSLGAIFVYFFLNRIIFVMAILPIIALAGIVIGIKTIIKDKAQPKAYIGLILSLLGMIPSLFCTLLTILDTIARFS